MALNAYLKMKGQKQGDFKSNVTQKGREGLIMVIAVDHSIVAPRDAASGLSTGKRMHKPLGITKVTDPTTPLLYNALVHNENIPTFKLDFYTTQQTNRQESTGVEWNYFTIELTNASICSGDFRMLNNKNPELMRYEEYEQWGFVYQKIQWTYQKGGQTAIDDWEADQTA